MPHTEQRRDTRSAVHVDAAGRAGGAALPRCARAARLCRCVQDAGPSYAAWVVAEQLAGLPVPTPGSPAASVMSRLIRVRAYDHRPSTPADPEDRLGRRNLPQHWWLGHGGHHDLASGGRAAALAALAAPTRATASLATAPTWRAAPAALPGATPPPAARRPASRAMATARRQSPARYAASASPAISLDRPSSNAWATGNSASLNVRAQAWMLAAGLSPSPNVAIEVATIGSSVTDISGSYRCRRTCPD